MEEVDVAIVGAGLAGLSTALALRRVDPQLHVKVLDSRPAPSTSKYGGFVCLQPNGMKAAAAISPALRASLLRLSLPEKAVLLHGEDGALITRLDAPHPEWEGSACDDLVMASGGGEARVQGSRRRGASAPKGSMNLIIGWWELERLLLGLLPAHTVEYEASFLKYHETDAGVVAVFEGLASPLRCKVLLGCDGPFSSVRAQCVQDSEPAYDHTVKWTGRLDGHHVSLPLDFCAWFQQKPGQVFISHPLANGDVGWEALVNDRELQAAGYTYDESLGRVLKATDKAHALKAEQVHALPPAEALGALFEGWPRAVTQMVRYAPPEAVLESGVHVRSPAEMPQSMGKGRVAILGEAAHPLRPTNQDPSMALEDAAELAAFVQEYGLCKQALRRYDVSRRPRWRHVMQLTLAQGASTTTGVAISRGFLDYTQDLFRHDFKPLGPRRAHPAVRAARAGLAAGTLALAVLAAGSLVPSGGAKEGPEGQATGGKGVLARGRARVRGVLARLRHRIARTRAQRAFDRQVRAARAYAEHRVEGVTDAALDAAGTAAKSSVRHRVARAFGVF